MKFRTFSTAVAVALAFATAGAMAQDAWPNKPIKLIAPFAAGGPLDQVARIIAPKMKDGLGQTVVVENIAGAGSTLGIAAVARSAADGYTLGLGHTGSLAIGPHLYPNVGYDPLKSFAPISMLGDYTNILVVPASAPYKTVADLIKAARDNPGKITYGSAGNGSSNHLSGELLASMTGTKLTHVPYKGSAPAMIDLIGGRVDFMFDVMLNSGPHMQSGKLRPIAVTNTTGLSYVPGVPPVSRTVPGYEVLGFVCLIAAAGTPKPVIDKLHAETVRVMKLPDVVESFAKIGFDARSNTPTELAAVMKKELELWGPVVKSTSASTN